MKLHAIEKILARASGKNKVETGEIINARVDVAMIHDRGGPRVADHLSKLNVEKVWDKEKVVIVFDHYVPPPTVQNAEAQKKFRAFIRKYGFTNVYLSGAGICHQVVPEKGHAWPGAVIVGTDSHTTTYGAFGAFATGIGHTEMAYVLIFGELWLKVPEIMRFNITGEMPPMVMAKDVTLKIAGEVGEEGALYKAVEFSGPVIRKMDIDERMVFSNMSVEIGAKAGFIEPDEKTLAYVKGRIGKDIQPITTDPDYEYDSVFEVDVSQLEPQIALPHSIAKVKPVSEVEGIEIDQAFIGSCTGGRLNDLRVAAKILKGRKVNPRVRMVIVPASSEVYLNAVKEELINTFIEAGGIVCPPGCGPCVGGHMGVLASGEVCISAGNRNFKGRMGSEDSLIYVASPAVVAASAIEGKITDPRKIFK